MAGVEALGRVAAGDERTGLSCGLLLSELAVRSVPAGVEREAVYMAVELDIEMRAAERKEAGLQEEPAAAEGFVERAESAVEEAAEESKRV
jgi:hypothetical protein